MKYLNPINREKIRNLQGSFAWIPHAFMRKGFWNSLSQKELLLYLFLVLVSDRHGMSYYSFGRICKMLKMHLYRSSLFYSVCPVLFLQDNIKRLS